MKRHTRAGFLVLGVALTLALGFVSTHVSDGRSRPAASDSFVSFLHNGAVLSTVALPCNQNKVCANGIHVAWAAGSCLNGVQVPPIVAVWTAGNTLLGRQPPEVAPCTANGVTMKWTTTNVAAAWLHSKTVVKTMPVPGAADGGHDSLLGGKSYASASWIFGAVFTKLPVPSRANGFDMELSGVIQPTATPTATSTPTPTPIPTPTATPTPTQ